MKRALLVTAVVALIALFGFAAWLNPEAVEFRFTSERSVRMQLGLLLGFAFVGGGALALLLVGLWRMRHAMSDWQARRREKRAARIAGWERSGVALAWEGQLDRARSLLLRAWRRRPENSAPVIELARTYLDTGEVGRARQLLEEAVARDGTNLDLCLALAETARQGGDVNDAIRMFEAIRIEHPRAPRALLALRDLYERAERWPEAAQVQEAYAKVLSDAGAARAERERLLRYRYQAAMSAKPEERVELLSRVLEMDSGFLPAVVSLGDALVEIGRGGEAVKLWERAFRDRPSTVLFERLLGRQRTARDRQRVVQLLRKHRAALDEDAVHVLSARTALGDGDLDAAELELAGVAREATITQRLWAEIHIQRQRPEQALKELHRLAARELPLSGFFCRNCRRHSAEWTARCPGCQSWDSYQALVEIARS